MKITALITANGLGHFRRTVRILAELVKHRSGLDITVLAEPWQKAAVKDWPLAETLWKSGARFEAVPLTPGIIWNESPSTFDDNRLLNWETRVLNHPAIHNANVVLSDNLAGVLNVRSDAVLLGSFLWCEVFEPMASQSNAIARFVDHEVMLLEKYLPPCICVDVLAMPKLRELTTPVAVGFMCEHTPHAQGEPYVVAFLGGAAGLATATLARLAIELHDVLGSTLALPDNVIAVLDADTRGKVIRFSHSDAAYAALQLALVRPGTGTITDCVTWNVPMLALNEPKNKEMTWNASRVEALGIGLALPPPPLNPHQVAETARELLRSDWAAQQLARQPKDGIARAAEWLVRERL
ncbi:MAG: hypothetical protein K1X64_20350 [Myxococcaceae bacterium]|nr:hypothetical protein [Myxococcaceae bacterium]